MVYLFTGSREGCDPFLMGEKGLFLLNGSLFEGDVIPFQ